MDVVFNSLSVKSAATTRTSSLYSHNGFSAKLQQLMNTRSILSNLAKTEGTNETGQCWGYGTELGNPLCL